MAVSEEKIKLLCENKQITVLNDLCTLLIRRTISMVKDKTEFYVVDFLLNMTFSTIISDTIFVSRVLLLFSKTWFLAIVLILVGKFRVFWHLKMEKVLAVAVNQFIFTFPSLDRICAFSFMRAVSIFDKWFTWKFFECWSSFLNGKKWPECTTVYFGKLSDRYWIDKMNY